MKRVVAALAVLASMGAIAFQGTYAGYSATLTNSVTASTQTVLPPQNLSQPTITDLLGGLLGSLSVGTVQGRVGSWAAVNSPSYTVVWQQFSGGQWNDIRSAPATLIDTGVIGDLLTLTLSDLGKPLRIRVTATDAAAAPVSSTTAVSGEVS